MEVDYHTAPPSLLCNGLYLMFGSLIIIRAQSDPWVSAVSDQVSAVSDQVLLLITLSPHTLQVHALLQVVQ